MDFTFLKDITDFCP